MTDPTRRDVAPLEDPGSQRTEPLDTELFPETQVAERWRDEGYTGRVRVVEGGRIACDGCAEPVEPEEVRVDHQFRYEGVSAPQDLELLLAVTCGRCGTRGVLTVAYGAAASGDEAEALRRLPAARDR